MRRWSDNEKKFGPFTYARDNKHYRPLAMVLDSGDDEYPGASFRMRGFGHTFIVQLPAIIKPWKRWVDLSNRDWAETPSAGYWDIHSREYGFSVADCINVDAAIELSRKIDTPQARAVYRAFRKQHALLRLQQTGMTPEKVREEAFFKALDSLGVKTFFTRISGTME